MHGGDLDLWPFMFVLFFVLFPIGFAIRPTWRKINDEDFDEWDIGYMLASAGTVIVGTLLTVITRTPLEPIAYLPIVVLSMGFIGGLLVAATFIKTFRGEGS